MKKLILILAATIFTSAAFADGNCLSSNVDLHASTNVGDSATGNANTAKQ